MRSSLHTTQYTMVRYTMVRYTMVRYTMVRYTMDGAPAGTQARADPEGICQLHDAVSVSETRSFSRSAKAQPFTLAEAIDQAAQVASDYDFARPCVTGRRRQWGAARSTFTTKRISAATGWCAR